MAKFITELFGFCGFKHRVLVACFWAEFIWFVLERVDLLPESCDLIIGKLQGLLKSSRFKRGIEGVHGSERSRAMYDDPCVAVEAGRFDGVGAQA